MENAAGASLDVGVGPLSGSEHEHSIERVLTLLSRVRMLSLGGILSLLGWELIEILFLGHKLSLSTYAELIAISIFAPMFIWMTTSCVSKLAQCASGTQHELILSNGLARREIEEREMAEIALSEHAKLYEILYQKAPHTYFSASPTGVVQTANKSASNMLGYPLEEFIGMNVIELYADTPDGKEKASRLRMEIQEGKEVSGEELQMKRADGSLVWVSLTVQNVQDDEGNLISSLGMVVDITERKEAEAKLKQHTDELARSNADLQQFAYVASHDLQEPLRMVSSYTQLLARRYKGRLDEDADTYIEYAVDGARRMQRLIQDLLVYSRVGSGETPLVLKDVNVIVNDALTNLRAAIESSDAEITLGPLPEITCEPSQITQLFQNIIGNAIKYRGDDPPHICISAERDEREWTFSVKDNGIGIDRKFSDRIFVLFKKLHAIEEYEGTGIGLAICKKIVERQGGRIWVDSEAGHGSNFQFTVPNSQLRVER